MLGFASSLTVGINVFSDMIYKAVVRKYLGGCL